MTVGMDGDTVFAALHWHIGCATKVAFQGGWGGCGWGKCVCTGCEMCAVRGRGRIISSLWAGLEWKQGGRWQSQAGVGMALEACSRQGLPAAAAVTTWTAGNGVCHMKRWKVLPSAAWCACGRSEKPRTVRACGEVIRQECEQAALYNGGDAMGKALASALQQRLVMLSSSGTL